MARHDLLHSDVWSDGAETTSSIDVLIQPGLHRAFPLPAEGHADDDRFRLLLEALAQRHRPSSREAPPHPARD